VITAQEELITECNSG